MRKCFSFTIVALSLGLVGPVLAQNKVLVPGNPPLTQNTFDKVVAGTEKQHGQLTDNERLEFQQSLTAYWKNMTRIQRVTAIKKIDEMYAELIGGGNPLVPGRYEYARFKKKEPSIKLEKEKNSLPEKPVVGDNAHALIPAELIEKNHGNNRKPTVMEGLPALEQANVNEYVNYFKWHHDQKYMGGWSDKHLNLLRQLIADDWQKADGAGRDAVLADLTWWKEVFPKLAAAERRKRPPAYMKFVRDTAADDIQRSAWLKDVDSRMDMEMQLKLKALGLQHETNLRIINNMRGPDYEYRNVYNPRTGITERTRVPK